jgi:hypothetical protein
MPHRLRPQGKACKNNPLRQIWPITTLESNMSLDKMIYKTRNHFRHSLDRLQAMTPLAGPCKGRHYIVSVMLRQSL